MTRICPSREPGGELRLALSRGTFQDAYGLGEQFLAPGEVNGNWAGKVRTPGAKYGNSLVAYQGGAVGNAQFPVLYALGPGRESFALFVDHTPAQTWNLAGDPWRVETTGESLRFYVILGRDLPALREKFMEIVGRPTIPPKKAFGLWVSEFGFRNWREVEGKLKSLEANRFPVDGFVLDVYWYGDFRQSDPDNPFGRLAWDLTKFPRPQAELAKLSGKHGVDLMLAEDPFLTRAHEEYRAMAERGFMTRKCEGCEPSNYVAWWGTGGKIDWSNEAGAAFWHDWKRQPLVEQGVNMHWTDLAEPEAYTDEDWYQGTPGQGHSERDNHNLFALKWVQGIDEGYRRNRVDRRHFTMARSGGPGMQRFGAGMWSGDIGSNLKSLAGQMNVQTQMSLSGLDYFGCDVGGFHRGALEGDLDELYTKWFAHSAMLDVPLRPHTDNGSKRNETAPDRIGDVEANLLNLRRRYELSPYYYSLAHLAWKRGEPVFPPLVYYYQEDPATRALADEKMIGRDLLLAVAPRNGEKQRDVYLPAGTWFDYEDGRRLKARASGSAGSPNIATVISACLFSRARGRSLPHAGGRKTRNIVGRRKGGREFKDLYLRIFPSAKESRFTLFEDDGETLGYQRGEVAETRISQVLADAAGGIQDASGPARGDGRAFSGRFGPPPGPARRPGLGPESGEGQGERGRASKARERLRVRRGGRKDQGRLASRQRRTFAGSDRGAGG